MSLRRKGIALAAAAVLVAVAVGVTQAATGGGPAPNVDFVTGDRVDTPSGTWVNLTTKSVTVAAGPILVRFSAEGYEQDFNRLAQFVGRSYAAMQVRVLLNGTAMSPGRVTFFDNSGKVGVRNARPTSAGYEWAGTVAAPGSQQLKLQFRNVHTWDSATILRWTVAIQHA